MENNDVVSLMITSFECESMEKAENSVKKNVFNIRIFDSYSSASWGNKPKIPEWTFEKNIQILVRDISVALFRMPHHLKQNYSGVYVASSTFFPPPFFTVKEFFEALGLTFSTNEKGEPETTFEADQWQDILKRKNITCHYSETEKKMNINVDMNAWDDFLQKKNNIA